MINHPISHENIWKSPNHPIDWQKNIVNHDQPLYILLYCKLSSHELAQHGAQMSIKIHVVNPHSDISGWTTCMTISTITRLVGGLEHLLFFHILGTIIPTKELIFSREVGRLKMLRATGAPAPGGSPWPCPDSWPSPRWASARSALRPLPKANWPLGLVQKVQKLAIHILVGGLVAIFLFPHILGF